MQQKQHKKTASASRRWRHQGVQRCPAVRSARHSVRETPGRGRWSQLAIWPLTFSHFACLFVCLFVCLLVYLLFCRHVGACCVVRGAIVGSVSGRLDGSREGRERSAGLQQLQQTGEPLLKARCIKNKLKRRI